MPDRSYDVCVIGGGPAGCVAALRLATLGQRVCLVEREGFPRRHAGESLSPGIRPLLDSLGLHEALVGFPPAGDTLLLWSDPLPLRIPVFRHGGVVVERGAFDRRLLDAARGAGADVSQPARACVSRAPGGWSIETGERATRLSARYLIDAAGRSGALRGRRVTYSPATLAVWAHLKTPRDRTSRLEALSDGWMWSAAIGERRATLMMFSDASTVKARTRHDMARWLRTRLAATQLFADWADAPFVTSPVLLDATCAFAADPMGADCVKIGEAETSFDPLSSMGVEHAIRSAIAGAAIAHTLLRHPERRETCRRFLEARQREAVATHRSWAGEYYRDVRRFSDEPFWASRSQVSPVSPPTETTIVQPAPPSTAMVIRLAPDASIADEPCLVGDTIDLRPAVHAPSLTRPVAFVDGVEIAPLLADVADAPRWETLVQRWSRRVPPPSAACLVAWLWERRVLCGASGKPRGHE